MDIQQLLNTVLVSKASDLHLLTDIAPMLRVDGDLAPVLGQGPLGTDDLKNMMFSIMTEEQKELFLANKELDFSYAFENKARFRVNVYFQKGTPASAFRLIPMKIPTISELNLPEICHTFGQLKQGFVLVTGPTGHGKSTTLASIINEINRNRKTHIVTIEDPIEYVFTPNISIISQREMHLDTHSWDLALKSVLREDPDVVLVGEMRDYETIQAALTVAETGHLVFATLHTNSASQTIDRIVGVFPEEQQQQVKHQLASTIEGVISQRLIPLRNGGRIPAVEILTGIPSVKTVIREGKTHLIDNIIQTSGELGMISIDKSLAKLVLAGKIDKDMALTYSNRPEEFISFLRDKK
ncbi:type IV pilus twitching motility protein PilT [Candidatus Microgenomates bacterium]|nr:type IV pilus twitching motility protein PilT [Candidatus Microgenomates bacterium]